MFTTLATINWLSVLLAFIVYFLLGALWFTLLFPKPYRFSLGREQEAAQQPALIFVVGPALCTLVITLASAVLVYALHLESYTSALLFAGLVGVGFLAANTVNIAINPNIPRPLLYGLISGSYHLVGITAVSLILVGMK